MCVYSISVTMHGLLMIFYLVIPMFINGLTVMFLIVICVGVCDVCYP